MPTSVRTSVPTSVHYKSMSGYYQCWRQHWRQCQCDWLLKYHFINISLCITSRYTIRIFCRIIMLYMPECIVFHTVFITLYMTRTIWQVLQVLWQIWRVLKCFILYRTILHCVWQVVRQVVWPAIWGFAIYVCIYDTTCLDNIQHHCSVWRRLRRALGYYPEAGC